MLRIVLDTNVLVSATISEGKPRDLLSLARRGEFLLIISEQIVEEFVGVLQRPKFKTTKKEVQEAGNALVKTGRIIKVTSTRKAVEDSDDDIFINTALDGNADYIVSGDPHLLKLEKYKGIEIVTVDFMLKKFGY
jgi:putative PIN family toxin of toxin-antitoxin system